MADLDIVRQRLLNQHIASPLSGRPEDVVAWLGAVQAQDYPGAKWTVGLRLQGAVDADVERAFNEGAILRTHLLRPTWHFITPADIRWLLALTGPRVQARNGPMYRRLELDDDLLKRTDALLAAALQGGQQLTRQELRAILQDAGIITEGGQRLNYIVMHAELDGVICSGARRGKQLTYALLDERVPPAKPLERDEALAELARRYWTSRGPATVHDFAKWSGLAVADARRGIEAIEAHLVHEVVDGRSYWFPVSASPVDDIFPRVDLLSIYDEYVSGYRDRSAVIIKEHAARLVGLGNALTYIIVIDGQIVGTWRRAIDKQIIHIRTNPFIHLTKTQESAVVATAQRHGAFFGLPVVL